MWAWLRSDRDFFSEINPGQNVQAQHCQGDQQGTGPSQVHPVLIGAHGKLENDHRQVGHGRVHVQGIERVVQCGEEQGGGFAADTRQGQQNTTARAPEGDLHAEKNTATQYEVSFGDYEERDEEYELLPERRCPRAAWKFKFEIARSGGRHYGRSTVPPLPHKMDNIVDPCIAVILIYFS